MKLDSVAEIVEALNGARVRYLVVGGLAVIAHGYLRFTKDLDLVIQLETENLRRAFEAMGRLGYKPLLPVQVEQFADASIRESWIHERNMMVFQLWSDRHRDTPIDIFVREPFDFDREYLAAMRKSVREGLDVHVVGLDALIAMKEEAGRPSDQLDLEHLRLRRGDTPHG